MNLDQGYESDSTVVGAPSLPILYSLERLILELRVALQIPELQALCDVILHAGVTGIRYEEVAVHLESVVSPGIQQIAQYFTREKLIRTQQQDCLSKCLLEAKRVYREFTGKELSSIYLETVKPTGDILPPPYTKRIYTQRERQLIQARLLDGLLCKLGRLINAIFEQMKEEVLKNHEHPELPHASEYKDLMIVWNRQCRQNKYTNIDPYLHSVYLVVTKTSCKFRKWKLPEQSLVSQAEFIVKILVDPSKSTRWENTRHELNASRNKSYKKSRASHSLGAYNPTIRVEDIGFRAARCGRYVI